MSTSIRTGRVEGSAPVVRSLGPATDFPGLPYESDAFEPAPAGELAAGLDSMPPGAELGSILAEVDVDSLSGYARVVVLRAHQRMMNHHQAKLYDAMRSVHSAVTDESVFDLPDADLGEMASAEVQCALRLTRRTADVELSFALALARRLPRVLRMLARGTIDQRRARAIERGTIHLTAAAALDVVDRIAESAPEMTTGQLTARIRRLCIEADPQDAKERHDRSIADRKVILEATLDGTANLMGLNIPADRAAAIRRRIELLARNQGAADDRTMDQKRADVFLDLLSGRGSSATSKAGTRTGTVQLTCDLGTLAGLVDHAGELNGYGPVIADVARKVAAENPDAQWTYAITDPEHGNVRHTGTTRRRPTTAQKRHVAAQHDTCCWPGCRMPAIDCDLDHTRPFSRGGATCSCNLVPLCRHHHVLRHNGWTYTFTDNTITWTSPLGHTYATKRGPP